MTVARRMQMGAAGAGGVGSLVSGYLALWDASDTGSITDDGTGHASAWADQSANNYDLSRGVSAERPATGSASINGLNVLSFDGGDVLALTDGTPSLTAPTTATIFVVGEVSSTTGYRTLCGGGGNAIQLRINDSTNTFTVNKDGVANIVTTTDSVGTNSPFVVAVKFADSSNGNSASAWVNGGSAATNTHGQTLSAAAEWQIGRQTGEAFVGYIGEVIYYDSVLSNADVASNISYLRNKWGI